MWELIIQAGITVQLVMIVLIFLSILSWGYGIKSFLLLQTARHDFNHFCKVLAAATSLADIAHDKKSLLREIFNKFYQHLQLGDIAQAEKIVALGIAQQEASLMRHLPFLATCSSVSPYIGLFGTVWGIMNTFISISNVGQVNLQTIAPGISEALIATAMGLIVAIPALVMNNYLRRAATALISTQEITFDELIYSHQK